MRSITALLAAAHLLLLQAASAQPLPYNPTTVFLSPIDTDIAYILLPPTPSHTNGELASLNISSSIQTSNLQTTVLSTSLPFLDESDGNNRTSYVPAISKSGSIGVYAGSCSSPSSLWTYQSKNASSGSTAESPEIGEWIKMTASQSSATASTDLPNANFLASAFYFSTLVDTDDTNRPMYTFGGMCPTTTTSNISAWQGSATYSNKMLKITTPESPTTSYGVSLVASTGLKPVPEAGLTITGLIPTFSNSSAGIATQARTYVVIGGHTKGAFIGMDQVAMFSLPQESWSFQAINTDTVLGGSELAVIRSGASKVPDSRSGHTSLLSSDGTKIIVFGGWVGDVDTPAEPQLVVLKLGSGFGGDGDWTWDIPAASGSGLAGGEGIYGHGAAMLPGDVMMVVGGYMISASAAKAKRADSPLQTFFLNTTSMAWVTDYTNPSYVSRAADMANLSASEASDKSKKVAIGAGVGVGVAVIIGAIIVYFWYAKKLKVRRVEVRERNLQALGQIAHREGLYGPFNDEMVQRQSSQNLGNRSISAGHGNDSAVYEPVSHGEGYDHEDDGSVSYVVPTPRNDMTIPRKPPNPRNARGYYQPPSNSTAQYSSFDFGTNHNRSNSLGTAGAIHPIYEADEDNDIANSNLLNVGQAMGYPTASYDDYSDPFADGPRSPGRLKPYPLQHPGNAYRGDRNTPSPDSPAKEREREVKEWVADWAAADAMIASHSRSQSLTNSGTNSGRTDSNLSERSAVTLSRSESQHARNNSLTGFFGPNWNPFASIAGPSSGTVGKQVEYVQGTYVGNSGRVTAEEYYTNGSISPDSDRSGGLLNVLPRSAGSGSNSGTSSSFVTAQTSSSFTALRAEAETLLPRPGEVWESGSPSKSKGLKRKPHGWLGSIKRVFGQEEWVGSPGLVGQPYVDSPSPTRAAFGNEVYRDETDSEPKRTASASAMLWRRKQGKGDWEDSAEGAGQSVQRSFTDAGRSQKVADREEEEWDVEKAVRSRVVQVMFTVPKERLRVVNQDDDVSDDESDIGMQREPSPIRPLFSRRDDVEMEDVEKGKGRESPSPVPQGSPSPFRTPTLSRQSSPVPHGSPSPFRTPTLSRPSSPTKSLKGTRVQELVHQLERRGSM